MKTSTAPLDIDFGNIISSGRKIEASSSSQCSHDEIGDRSSRTMFSQKLNKRYFVEISVNTWKENHPCSVYQLAIYTHIYTTVQSTDVI